MKHKPFKRFFEVPRDLWSKSGVQIRKNPKGLSGVMIIGDDTGLIKIVSAKQRKLMRIFGQQNVNRKIKKIIWNRGCYDKDNENEFIAYLSNGDIRVYNSKIGSYKTPIKNEKNCIGMYVIDNKYSENDSELNNSEKLLFTCNNVGKIRIWGIDCNKNNYESEYINGDILGRNDNNYDITYNQMNKNGNNIMDDNDVDFKDNDEQQYIDTFKKYQNLNENKKRGCLLSEFNMDNIVKMYGYPNYVERKMDKTDEEKRFDKLWKLKLKKTRYQNNNGLLKCMKGHSIPNTFPYIAFAGYDRPVEVWDFIKMKPIFKGKHVCIVY